MPGGRPAHEEAKAMYDRAALEALVRELALEVGQFRLASGKTSTYYLDCRKVTLDWRGANLVAEGLLELLGEPWPDAVGGMAIGADPITAAMVTVAGRMGRPLRGFIVRKEAKQHGMGRQVEGPVAAGQRVVVVEDVVTSGASALAAIDAAEAFGLKVEGVLAVMDRLEGGRESLAQRGYPLKTLLTIRDFGL
jgi:orotate phosphoribosyltransferase